MGIYYFIKKGLYKQVTRLQMKKFLACSGGGDRGTIILGMLEELYTLKGKNSVKWDEMAGISVGGFIAAYLSQADEDSFCHMVANLKSSVFSGNFNVVSPWIWGGEVLNFLNSMLHHSSIYSNENMKSMLDTWYHPQKSKKPFHIGVYNKTMSRYETFSSTDGHDMRQICLASAAVPVVFPEVPIGRHRYQDGGMRHIIPVEEIKTWIERTEGPKHVDILVCFPIHKPELFTKMTVPIFHYPLVDEATRMVSDLMLEQLQNDLKELSRMCNIEKEQLTKSPCGEFKNGDLSFRILSPSEGHYSSMRDMSKEKNIMLYNSGTSVVKEYLLKM